MVRSNKFILFFVTLLLYSSFLLSQDTVSVFFKSGSRTIEAGEAEKLNSMPFHFDLSELDSVAFIGMADSVGNFESNKKLSEKRAKAIAKHCRGLVPKGTAFSVNARGELSK